jgi:quinol monooxygenase YgiN
VATILAHIRTKPGLESRFEQTAASLYRETHAAEDGARRYDHWCGAEPRLYYALLSFDSFPAFLTHQTSDHHEGAGPALAETIEQIRLEWVDPLADASPLVETNSQPLPRGASELTALYHRQYAVQVQDWWLPLRRGP